MFRFLRKFHWPQAKLGRVPTRQEFITYKDVNTWSI
jgi:hypothetical protein